VSVLSELQNLSSAGTYERASALVRNFLIELEHSVRKMESGKSAAGSRPSQNAPLERAYFHDILDLLFGRTAGECGQMLRGIHPVALRRQLRDDLMHSIKHQAHRIIIDSELSDTGLLDDFSVMLSDFLSQVEKEARCPPIAA
jgi:hypothetical protein